MKLVMSFLCVILSAVVAYQYVRISDLEDKVPHLPSDQHAIDRAVNQYARESGRTAHEAMKMRFPVVVRVQGSRCVALMLPRGWMGTVPVYCYDLKQLS